MPVVVTCPVPYQPSTESRGGLHNSIWLTGLAVVLLPQHTASQTPRNYYMKFSSISAAFIFILITACTSTPELTIAEFDAYRWKRDKYGCSGDRLPMAKALEEEREQLMGFNEQEVLKVLGRADEQELYKRNQKFLRYYLTPNSRCDTTESVEAQKKPSMLQVRLNAIGMVNEIHIVN